MNKRIQITTRDLQILREISFSRFLTVRHIAALCFEGRKEAAKKRLQKLVASGYIKSAHVFPGMPEVKFLTVTGWEALGNFKNGRARIKVPLQTLKHELLLRDCMCSAVSAARALGLVADVDLRPMTLKILGWGCARRLTPDGVFKLKTEGGNFTFFCELDRGTEKQPVLDEKVSFYQEFLAKQTKAAFFAVIFVFEHKKRLERFSSRCQKEQPDVLLLLSSTQDFLANPFKVLGLI